MDGNWRAVNCVPPADGREADGVKPACVLSVTGLKFVLECPSPKSQI